VLRPLSERRDQANRAADSAGLKSAAGCAAKAAFYAGARPEAGRPLVPDDPARAAQLAAASVLWSVVRAPLADIPRLYRQVIALGIDVENHTNRWKKAPSHHG
jgi:hypothetical protein